MAFRGTWRTYQASLLDRLESYLDDKRLHIVAAPGSGKTVFGLEVVRRLNQPTLILAPTITIRNQWAERLVQYFIPETSAPVNWLSTDIRRPELLTIATYQALHAICSGDGETEDDTSTELENDPPKQIISDTQMGGPPGPINLPQYLSEFRTLVVDEAHHLQAEWWKTLTLVVGHLNPTIVALTATPPYDVSPFEWQRYEELCGPVDGELATPELVLQGDLCPHQDYVYFSYLTPFEQQTLAEFRALVESFVEHLRQNRDFAAAVVSHPWLNNPNGNLEEILSNPAYLSSMIIYLNASGEQVRHDVLRSLGISSGSIPPLSLEWIEILLTNCLYTDAERFHEFGSVLKSIHHDLSKIGAIERRKVVLRNRADQTKLLTTSKTKLRSIHEIVRVESQSLGDRLRCVVLTDFIRKEKLPSVSECPSEFDDIGAVPIFETLRRSQLVGIRLGVLCGSLVIVPASSRQLISEMAATIGIKLENLSFQPVPHDPEYLLVDVADGGRQGSVRLITSVFEKGGITVLIGTKALLGEGWDAPVMNTLILATFVGSYVLSNQMRGRSIRVDPACPAKTANIWHLVCVETGALGPGEDYATLTRRCSAFVGVSASSPTIENGVDRLGLGRPPYSGDEIDNLNAQTIHRAVDRQALRTSWDEALASGPNKQLTHGITTPERNLPRDFVLRNTIAALLVEAGTLAAAIFLGSIRGLARMHTSSSPFTPFAIALGLAAVAGLPNTVLAVWRLIRHGTPERSMRQIGLAVIEALKYEGSLSASSEFRVYADRNRDGYIYCWLGGGTARDQTIFLRALRETLSPIENPRFLLAKTRLWRFFGEDYFVVPGLLGRKREVAEAYATNWRKLVGPVRLVFTRTPEGRAILLRARMHSLSAAFQSHAERLSCWK